MPEDTYRVTLEDVAAFGREMEQQCGMAIVLELRPVWAGQRAEWRVEAKAYKIGEEALECAVVVRGRNYPSRRRQTFPGAALDALMELDAAITAYQTLERMRP